MTREEATNRLLQEGFEKDEAGPYWLREGERPCMARIVAGKDERVRIAYWEPTLIEGEIT